MAGRVYAIAASMSAYPEGSAPRGMVAVGRAVKGDDDVDGRWANEEGIGDVVAVNEELLAGKVVDTGKDGGVVLGVGVGVGFGHCIGHVGYGEQVVVEVGFVAAANQAGIYTDGKGLGVAAGGHVGRVGDGDGGEEGIGRFVGGIG